MARRWASVAAAASSKVTCLPHIGSATHETRLAMAERATTNLLAALAAERPAAVYPRQR